MEQNAFDIIWAKVAGKETVVNKILIVKVTNICHVFFSLISHRFAKRSSMEMPELKNIEIECTEKIRWRWNLPSR